MVMDKVYSCELSYYPKWEVLRTYVHSTFTTWLITPCIHLGCKNEKWLWIGFIVVSCHIHSKWEVLRTYVHSTFTTWLITPCIHLGCKNEKWLWIGFIVVSCHIHSKWEVFTYLRLQYFRNMVNYSTYTFGL